jgi:MFS family permease
VAPTLRLRDANIWRVYATTFALGAAYGVAISLIAIFLDERGFDKGAIGTLAAWFASGIVLFSLPAGALIRRFGPKPTLLASLVGYAIAVGVFPFLESYAAVAAVRFLDGAFSVGVWVSLETILLARADTEKKARVMSWYAIALAFGYVVGPLVARAFVAFAPLDLGFWMAGAISAAAALYVLVRLDGSLPAGSAEERGDAEPETPSLAVLWRIKTSCFATFAYGYFQASVVLFLPLFLIEEKSLAKEQTIVVPAFFAAGMLLFASIAARLGDRIGHLAVMRSLAAVGTLMILGFVWLDAYPLMCAAVFVAGATLASISPVSLALQGVVSKRRDLARATAIYNAFYAAGMLVGPPISSVLFQRLSGGAMLHHLAALWTTFVVFTLAFRRDDPAAARRRLLPWMAR